MVIYLSVFPCFFPRNRYRVSSIGYTLNFTANQLGKSKILSDMREYQVNRVSVRRESTVPRFYPISKRLSLGWSRGTPQVM